MVENVKELDTDKKVVTSEGTSFPSTPIEGQLFTRTDISRIFMYRGGWIEFSCCEFMHQEVHEHFLDQLVDIEAMVGNAKLIGNLIIVSAALIEKEDYTTLKIATASGIGAEMEIYGQESHDPSAYTYYQFDWTWYLDAVDIQNVYTGLMDAPFNEDYSCLIEKSATPGDIKFITTVPAGVEETDNITVDITVKHTYTIKIKSGEVKFYIDEVLKATHTTRVPYSVAVGLMFINYIESSAENSREWYIDSDNVVLGRVF